MRLRLRWVFRSGLGRAELLVPHTIRYRYKLYSVHNGFVNKSNGTTQGEASGTTQVRSADDKNQTDRIRHRKRCRRNGVWCNRAFPQQPSCGCPERITAATDLSCSCMSRPTSRTKHQYPKALWGGRVCEWQVHIIRTAHGRIRQQPPAKRAHAVPVLNI